MNSRPSSLASRVASRASTSGSGIDVFQSEVIYVNDNYYGLLVLSPPGQGPAVDEIGRSGHEAGIFRGEVAGELGDFLRGAFAADEVGRGHLRHARVLGPGGGGVPAHVRIDRPGAVTVH